MSNPKHVVKAETLNNFDTMSRYSLRPIEQDFVVESGAVLGTGLNGAVTKATNRFTGQVCALKVLHKKGLSQKERCDLKSEVNNYLMIDHPHIARLLHVYEDDLRVCLVMELRSGRELFDRLREKKRFSEEEARRVTYQMMLAGQSERDGGNGERLVPLTEEAPSEYGDDGSTTAGSGDMECDADSEASDGEL